MKYPKGFCFDIIDVRLISQFLPHKNKVVGEVMSSRPIEWACDLPMKEEKKIMFYGSWIKTFDCIPNFLFYQTLTSHRSCYIKP
jgi:hypothetical protein